MDTANGVTGDDIVRGMAERGFRRTRSRRVLAELIAAKGSHHFSALQLEQELAAVAPDVGRATLFRTLATLVRQGVVSEVHLPSGDHGYILCGASRTHHHHAICTKCGLVVAVDQCAVDARLQGVEEETHFRVSGHRLEYFGVCAACQVA